jgi:hypothetical protein
MRQCGSLGETKIEYATLRSLAGRGGLGRGSQSYMYVCMYVYIRKYVCMYVCIYVCTYVLRPN